MAGVSECFGIGSVVSCKTCNNKELEGEVLAFDPQTKMLILKSRASNGNSKLNDVHVINLGLVSDIVVKNEVNNPPEPPQSLNLQRINSRVKNEIDSKRRLVTALKQGVSIEGQNLFFYLSKTLPEVSWSGTDIVVLSHVYISHPYRPDNVSVAGTGTSHNDMAAVRQVTKMVEKHYQEQQKAGAANAVGNLAHSGASNTLSTPESKK